MKDSSFAKAVLLLNGSIPAVLLCYDAYQHHLGANPAEFTIKTTGTLTLLSLLLSLSITPLRLISGRNFLSHFRRLLGLFAFFYGLLHFSLYFTLDRSLDIPGTLADMLKRPFIFLGSASLLLMLPLALTSTNGMIKRLGAAKWKRLHQLAYPAAVLGVLHYYLLVKAKVTKPEAFAAVLALLLLYRILVKYFPTLKHQR